MHHLPHCSVTPQAVFYVPQKPYTTTGTLREQVIYPLTVDQAASRADGQSRVCTAAPFLDCHLPAMQSGYAKQASIAHVPLEHFYARRRTAIRTPTHPPQACCQAAATLCTVTCSTLQGVQCCCPNHCPVWSLAASPGGYVIAGSCIG